MPSLVTYLGVLPLPICLSRATTSHTFTNKHLIEVDTATAVAEKLLSTTWNRHENTATAQVVHRADGYTIPAHVADSIASLFSVHGYPLPPHSAIKAGVGAAPAIVTPAVIAST